ncbi:GL22675 [Drosophila persimilis]|uniref:GL22675 n=1 Tax=Drosophila persimilis TaxID=7234 RepID=B4H019_DROPE|nr:GL22675 [Drosophila persimilis]
MKCDTVFKGCIRNGYISALSVCLNQRRLYGIFEQMPPEELEWMDFPDTTNHTSSNRATATL